MFGETQRSWAVLILKCRHLRTSTALKTKCSAWSVAKWQSSYLVCTRPWDLLLVLQKGKRQCFLLYSVLRKEEKLGCPRQWWIKKKPTQNSVETSERDVPASKQPRLRKATVWEAESCALVCDGWQRCWMLEKDCWVKSHTHHLWLWNWPRSCNFFVCKTGVMASIHNCFEKKEILSLNVCGILLAVAK